MATTYERVTNKIIEILDAGVIPWHQPWASVGINSGDVPYNAVSGRAYNGLNSMILSAVCMIDGYDDPRFVTFKQAKQLGGNVCKGEKGTIIIYWSMFKVDETKDDGSETERTIPLMKTYTVFNVGQCENLIKLETIENDDDESSYFEPIETAQEIIDGWTQCPIKHGGNSAFYSPSADKIQVPSPEQFDSAEQYYKVTWHEMAHATGHELRLNRKIVNKHGSKDYAKEELIAEMSAAFLCGHVGWESSDLFESSAAYIQSWRQRLSNDPKLIVNAASSASKSVSFILNNGENHDN